MLKGSYLLRNRLDLAKNAKNRGFAAMENAATSSDIPSDPAVVTDGNVVTPSSVDFSSDNERARATAEEVAVREQRVAVLRAKVEAKRSAQRLVALEEEERLLSEQLTELEAPPPPTAGLHTTANPGLLATAQSTRDNPHVPLAVNITSSANAPRLPTPPNSPRTQLRRPSRFPAFRKPHKILRQSPSTI